MRWFIYNLEIILVSFDKFSDPDPGISFHQHPFFIQAHIQIPFQYLDLDSKVTKKHRLGSGFFFRFDPVYLKPDPKL